MANDGASRKASLKTEIEQKLHPPESTAAKYERLALDTLAALLESDDESIRLQAAAAILGRPKAAGGGSPASDLLHKLTGSKKKK